MIGSPEIDGFVFKQQLMCSARCTLWRAEQTVLERDVLIAVFGEEVLQNAGIGDALFGVVRTLAQHRSCLIPDIIDVIRSEHQAYVVLEDCHAQNILHLLNGHRLRVEPMLQIATALATGFAELQSAHLVYGGLRPKSLYISEDSEPVLPDLSVVTFEPGVGINPPVETLVGSAPYVAPEQYQAPGTVDTRADMFALGMTLYALVTGQVPFGALSPDEILQQKLKASIPSPCDMAPHFPDTVAAVLAKLAHRDAAKRYADWDEVLFDLHQASHGIMPNGEIYPGSVIAPPNPEAYPKPGRTIRLSVEDLRLYRQRHQKQNRAWVGSLLFWLGITLLLLFGILAVLAKEVLS